MSSWCQTIKGMKRSESSRYWSQALARVSGPAGSELLSHIEGQRMKKHRRVALRAVNDSPSIDIMVNRIIRVSSVRQTGCCFVFFPSPTKPHSLDRVVSLLFVSSFFLCLQPPCFLFRHRSLGSLSPLTSSRSIPTNTPFLYVQCEQPRLYNHS